MESVPKIRTFLLGMVLLGVTIAGQLIIAAGRDGVGAPRGLPLLLVGAAGFAIVFRPTNGVSERNLVGFEANPVSWRSQDVWLPAAAAVAGAALSVAAWVELEAQAPSSNFWRVYAAALTLTFGGALWGALWAPLPT